MTNRSSIWLARIEAKSMAYSASSTSSENELTVVVKRRIRPFVNPHGHSWEAPSFYFILNVALILLGPGLYSFDWLLFGRWYP